MWEFSSPRRSSQPEGSGSWLAPAPDLVDLEVARVCIERGAGGDVDAGGRLARRGTTWVPGLKRTVSLWLRLYERVQRGELGGPDDGRRA